jgi:hypothetical protein
VIHLCLRLKLSKDTFLGTAPVVEAHYAGDLPEDLYRSEK